MVSDQTIYLIGAGLGFGVFTLSTSTMGNIFFRPTSDGKKKFTLEGFVDYLKAPFAVGTHKFDVVWGRNLPLEDKIKMFQLNWVAMVGTGLAASAAVILSKKMFL